MSIEDFPQDETFKNPDEEKPPERESEAVKEKLPDNYFSRAESLEEVFEMLEKLGGIQGSEEYYPAEQQKEEIEKMRHSMGGAVTRTGGLRKKVRELLENERTSGKG